MLLILALTGENGLFGRAKEARNETQIESEEEQIKLEVMASWDENGKLHFDKVKETLEYIQGVESIADKGFPITVTFSKTRNSYKVDGSGNIVRYVNLVTYRTCVFI